MSSCHDFTIDLEHGRRCRPSMPISLIVPWFEGEGPRSGSADSTRPTGGQLARAIVANGVCRASLRSVHHADRRRGTGRPHVSRLVGAGVIGSGVRSGTGAQAGCTYAPAGASGGSASLAFATPRGLRATLPATLTSPASRQADRRRAHPRRVQRRELARPSIRPRLGVPRHDRATPTLPPPESARIVLDRGRVLASRSNLARELANEPGNTLTPREFASAARPLASEARRQRSRSSTRRRSRSSAWVCCSASRAAAASRRA